jgi:hypothetical protein
MPNATLTVMLAENFPATLDMSLPLDLASVAAPRRYKVSLMLNF